MDKKMYMIGMTIGSFLGSYVPMLWGDTELLSISGVLFSALGGLLGIYLVNRLLN
jgi:hypothetical protein